MDRIDTPAQQRHSSPTTKLLGQYRVVQRRPYHSFPFVLLDLPPVGRMIVCLLTDHAATMSSPSCLLGRPVGFGSVMSVSGHTNACGLPFA